MRISENIIYNSMRNSVMENQSRLYEIQQKISENRRLVYLSDDPRASEKAAQLQTSKAEMDQFKRNITFGKATLELTENALQGVGDLLVRARELAMQLASGDANASDRQSAGAEIGEIRKQIVSYANTKIGSEYIFSGFRSNTAAYASDGTWQGDTGEKMVRIGQSEQMRINEIGVTVFGTRVAPGDPYTPGGSIMEDLARFEAALLSNDVPGIQQAIDTMDLGQQKVLQSQADLGTRTKHMDVTSTALNNLTNTITSQLSDIQDLNIAEVSTELLKQQAIYEAAVQVAGQISRLTILDAIG